MQSEEYDSNKLYLLSWMGKPADKTKARASVVNALVAGGRTMAEAHVLVAQLEHAVALEMRRKGKAA